MNKNLQILQLGNPNLRQKSIQIKDISDGQIQQLIDNLIATVTETNGVGIAAPQVGEFYRLLIVASRPNSRYPHAPKMPPTAMINPKIVDYSTPLIKGWEGCLSVPGIRGLVPRYQAITIEYTDRNGNLKTQELTDFVARIFQHEYDHLEGKVFLDRVESTQDLMTEAEYRKQHLLSNTKSASEKPLS